MIQHLKSEGADQSAIDSYTDKITKDRNMPLTRRKSLAAEYTKSPIFFSWDIPRTREGFYHYKAGLPAATKRAIEFAPYADLLWLETADPSVKKAAGFAGEIHEKYPDKKLVYNLSPSFNWMGQGFNDDSLRSFVWDLAKHGYVISITSYPPSLLIALQFCPSVDFTSWSALNRHDYRRALERVQEGRGASLCSACAKAGEGIGSGCSHTPEMEWCRVYGWHNRCNSER